MSYGIVYTSRLDSTKPSPTPSIVTNYCYVAAPYRRYPTALGLPPPWNCDTLLPLPYHQSDGPSTPSTAGVRRRLGAPAIVRATS
jgi:hypothetical protein